MFIRCGLIIVKNNYKGQDSECFQVKKLISIGQESDFECMCVTRLSMFDDLIRIDNG